MPTQSPAAQRAVEIPAMDSAQLAECLSILGWDGRHLARELDRDEKMVRRWLDRNSGATIPPPAAAWVLDLAAYRRAHPPPAMERARGKSPATSRRPSVDAAPSAGPHSHRRE